jgi:hypothetical protein
MSNNDSTLSQTITSEQRIYHHDGKIYFLTRRKGLIFDTKYWMQIDNINYNIDDTDDEEVKNKIINRIVQFDTIDVKNFKALISYANRELPDKDVATHIIPLIAHCLEVALTTEMHIQLTLKSTLVKQLNFYKNAQNLEVKNQKETSVFSRMKYFLMELYGKLGDFFSNNVEIEKGNLKHEQYADGIYKPQYFQ